LVVFYVLPDKLFNLNIFIYSHTDFIYNLFKSNWQYCS
jgi:hypothetical protein